ncbi:hypothetical protein O181_112984 [Austropuccinia psidii MF-1]|uniref:Uncharacterized protein n=1 Tax=Austropuccinia psidii MF-1 TaxID=1389203 RepID=A0A9Q3K2T3_9BASI|nr:hypothetical protein [Austropuccinia psidii MF-1]
MSFSLIAIISQPYLDTIQSDKPSNGRWKKHGVQQIDIIENNRNPTPNVDVIYILAPIAKKMDRIIGHFSPHGSTGKKAPPEGFNKCAGAHFFFLVMDPQVDTLPPPNPRSFSALYAPPPIQSAEQLLDIWEEETFWTSTSPLELFEKRQLAAVASVEHCCLRGITAEGRTPKAIVQEMVPLFDDSILSTSDKLRIVALHVLYQHGVPDKDRR